MALKIRGENREDFPKDGWGVVGEELGNASTETLGYVLPLEDRETAQQLAGSHETSRLDGKSWLVSPVSLVDIKLCKDGSSEALYVEASNLTHPG